MTGKQPATNSYHEIVKYNSRTRKDPKVLPGKAQGLYEANRSIDTLNALLRTSKEDERGDVFITGERYHHHG